MFYWVSYVLLASLVTLSLFIGAITLGMAESMEEVRGRSRGDVGEMWARCGGDIGRYLELEHVAPHRHALLPPLVAHDDRLARGDLVVDLADQPAQRRGALARAARGRDVAEI